MTRPCKIWGRDKLLQAKHEAVLQQKCTVPEILQICPKAEGEHETEPVQVVVATDPAAWACHVITAYRPDIEHFEQI
jgi:hypothetical protein